MKVCEQISHPTESPFMATLHILPQIAVNSGTMLGFDCGYVCVGTHLPDYMANNSQCPLEFHVSHQWSTEKNCSWAGNYHWIRTILFHSPALHSSNWPNFLQLSYVTDRIFPLYYLNPPAQPPWMCRKCIPPKCHNILTTMWCINTKQTMIHVALHYKRLIVMSMNGTEMNAVSIKVLGGAKLGIMYN